MHGLRCEYCGKTLNKEDLLVVWLHFYKIRFYHKICYVQALKEYFSPLFRYRFFILNSPEGKVSYFLSYILGILFIFGSVIIYTKVNLVIGIIYTLFSIFVILSSLSYIYTYKKYSKYFGS